jgi:hypothetical protein
MNRLLEFENLKFEMRIDIKAVFFRQIIFQETQDEESLKGLVLLYKRIV